MPDTSQEFHDSLIELKGDVKEILRRLAVQNGAIAGVVAEQLSVKLALVKHPLECPIGQRFNNLETQMLTGDHPITKEALHAIKEVDNRLVDLRDEVNRGEIPLSQIGAARLADMDQRIEKVMLIQAGQQKAQGTLAWIAEKFGIPLLTVILMVIAMLALKNSDLFLPHDSSTSTSTQTTSHTDSKR